MPSTPQDPVTGHPCRFCSPEDSLTHSTEEHDEDYVRKLDPCEECGSKSGEDCKPGCLWAYCRKCGIQIEQHPDSKECE